MSTHAPRALAGGATPQPRDGAARRRRGGAMCALAANMCCGKSKDRPYTRLSPSFTNRCVPPSLPTICASLAASQPGRNKLRPIRGRHWRHAGARPSKRVASLLQLTEAPSQGSVARHLLNACDLKLPRVVLGLALLFLPRARRKFASIDVPIDHPLRRAVSALTLKRGLGSPGY